MYQELMALESKLKGHKKGHERLKKISANGKYQLRGISAEEAGRGYSL